MNSARFVALLGLALASNAAFGQSMPSDKEQVVSKADLNALVSECVTCHGPEGRSTNSAIPSLAGKKAEDILKSVEQFYFYERHCPDAKGQKSTPKSGARNMCDVADRMTRQEVLAVGHYFEGQSPK